MQPGLLYGVEAHGDVIDDDVVEGEFLHGCGFILDDGAGGGQRHGAIVGEGHLWAVFEVIADALAAGLPHEHAPLRLDDGQLA